MRSRVQINFLTRNIVHFLRFFYILIDGQWVNMFFLYFLQNNFNLFTDNTNLLMKENLFYSW